MAVAYWDVVEKSDELTWTATQMQPLLAQFQPISLAEMADVALLDRMETKYVLGVSQLCAALQPLTQQYRVLEINGIRLSHYQTVYFDTHEFSLYQQHHNGFGSRYKVRARKYVESNLAFFEVKHKTNRDRTVKSRISIPDMLMELHGEADDFVDTYAPFAAAELEPKVWNEYMRVTLVSNHCQECLTLDVNIAFRWGNAYRMMDGVVIAEVKQDHLSQHSDFMRQMKQMGGRPASYSKYTAGVYSLYRGVKANNFKPQMRLVHKIMQEELSHECSR